MGKKTKRNIDGLLQYASALKRETEERVNLAIDKLKRSKTTKINFRTVSELSGVSTTTLYNNLALRERISSLRAVKKVVTPASPLIETAVRDRELRREIQKLKEEKQMLIVQLVDYERLKAENQQLKALLNERRLE